MLTLRYTNRVERTYRLERCYSSLENVGHLSGGTVTRVVNAANALRSGL